MPRSKTTKSEGGLGKGLSPEQYHVVRECGTEPPFRNAYWDNHEPGIYVDVVSGEPLFSSLDKFDSGTGWPSFTRPLEEDNVVRRRDRKLSMERTEVRSRGADSHLGHVFDDGPEPTGLRYCINSASLRFIRAADLEKEGYGKYRSLFSGVRRAEPGAAARTKRALFAAGCFWGVEAGFLRLPGVVRTTAGYTGGWTKEPSYEQVCSGATGHAEAVEVEFDPARISYRELLEAFWSLHDPSTLGKRAEDPASQYRSAIFFLDAEQEREAIESLSRFAGSGRFPKGISTRIEPASAFWPAEEYHQKFYEKTGAGICH